MNKFKLIKGSIGEMLTKEQMKNVIGGDEQLPGCANNAAFSQCYNTGMAGCGADPSWCSNYLIDHCYSTYC